MICGTIIQLFIISVTSFSLVHSWTSFQVPNQLTHGRSSSLFLLPTTRSSFSYRHDTTSGITTSLSAVKEPKTNESSIEETTEKYGLEAGLFKSLQQKDGGQSAKDLLAKYGVAYLATSIPLAIVSFAICYALVDSGVDVASLLSKVGIVVDDTGEKVGTFAIAYAAHKAASPIRFPPTVLLTPVVAKLIGKEPKEGEENDP